jgi:hypothetical protein
VEGDLMQRRKCEPKSLTVPTPKSNFFAICVTHKDVELKARASMRVNSESVSNEIDESDLQSEKQPEQRI